MVCFYSRKCFCAVDLILLFIFPTQSFIDLSISLYKKIQFIFIPPPGYHSIMGKCHNYFSRQREHKVVFFSGYRKQHSGERSCCFLGVLGLMSEFLPDKCPRLKLLPATPSAHSDSRCDSAVCSPSRLN